MDWEQEARDIIEALPLPPMIAHFAPMDAERRARKQGLSTVTVAIARETERGYEAALGHEAMELLRRAARGEDIGLPDEFFVEEPGELYSIQLCPAKFGASTLEKREQIRSILTPLRNKLKELNITGIIMDKASTSLMSHHVFRIGITGCSNACITPYFCDFGIIGRYRPGLDGERCTGCGACAAYCTDKAIVMRDGKACIDYARCVMCAGCTEVCPTGALKTELKGYKVVVGGTGSRHPHIADIVADFADIPQVLAILERAVRLFTETDMDGRFLSMRTVVARHGLERLRCG
ncbi:MAG: hypothetical protein N3B18_10855 [Desulfobacterota bacterium]|nr:hypothetical protein [Thermodesulfobacteriota bacterium]